MEKGGGEEKRENVLKYLVKQKGFIMQRLSILERGGRKRKRERKKKERVTINGMAKNK